MKRALVVLAIVGMLAGLGGAVPEATALSPSCQVVATTSPKSCSFIATGSRVVAHVVGIGAVGSFGPNGNGTAIGCPGAHLGCSGGLLPGFAGYPVTLYVKKGFGRIAMATVAVGV